MIEIRIHGRGGQGAVIASQILAQAAFREGMHVQAFPAFGSERRGAPVTAFLRLDRSPIWVRSEVYQPNGIMILDQSLIGLKSANVTAGLQPGGWILINSSKDASEFPELQGFAVTTVDASSIGRSQKLGSPTAPIVNTAMVGAVAELTGITKLDNLADAIRSAVPVKIEENVAASQEGAQAVRKYRVAEDRSREHVNA
jgi:pyruvate ferredoxin oxidoreductase gamma subunit/2-oxoisovalerate ferredoxin oxidoreductase gamma subunit